MIVIKAECGERGGGVRSNQQAAEAEETRPSTSGNAAFSAQRTKSSGRPDGVAHTFEREAGRDRITLGKRLFWLISLVVLGLIGGFDLIIQRGREQRIRPKRHDPSLMGRPRMHEIDSA